MPDYANVHDEESAGTGAPKTDEQKNAEIAEALGWVYAGKLGESGPFMTPDAVLMDCKFDTDPAAALGLVEEMREKGWAVEMVARALLSKAWRVSFVDEQHRFPNGGAYAPTLPQAIRDAAHAALCGSND